MLEISQPRAPCCKLAMHTERLDTPQGMTLTARCGWYYRGVEEGRAPSQEAALERIAETRGPSVRDTFRALFARDVDSRMLQSIHDAPALAGSWRRPLAAKIARIRDR